MTKNKAIRLYESGFWRTMTYKDRAVFQMFEPLLCMPFDVFHEAVEKTLDRPVSTHEFGLANEELKLELLGERPAPSLGDIINLIPKDKRLIIIAREDKNETEPNA